MNVDYINTIRPLVQVIRKYDILVSMETSYDIWVKQTEHWRARSLGKTCPALFSVRQCWVGGSTCKLLAIGQLISRFLFSNGNFISLIGR